METDASSVPGLALLGRLTDDLWQAADETVTESLYEPGCIVHDPLAGAVLCGPEAIHAHVVRIRAAFPDLRVQADDPVSSIDRLACRQVLRGTHMGPLGAVPATGRPVTVGGLQMILLGATGTISEQWNCWDVLGLYEQLGVAAITAGR